MQILTVKTSFYKNETIIFEISTQENMGFKKKSPVYLKGEAVESRNHSSVTIKFKFIKKLKRLPFSNRLIDFVQIFFVGCYFWSSLKWAHFHQNLRGWVNKGVQLSMEWPREKIVCVDAIQKGNGYPSSFILVGFIQHFVMHSFACSSKQCHDYLWHNIGMELC